MSQFELLSKVIKCLDAAGVEYMLTGSHSSSLQGEPRSTHDIDLVVDLELNGLDHLLREFSSQDYYLSEVSAREAIHNKSMFNLLHLDEGDKVDFWMLTDEPFDQSRFSRRQQIIVENVTIKVSSPEDTILAKLRWAKMSGGSEKQFHDALMVYEVRQGQLDQRYIEKWAVHLGIDELWCRLQSDSE